MQQTVLLVEDHSALRDGLRQVIAKTSGFRVVGETGDGVEGVHLARKLQPDIVLLDLGLPKMNGLDVLMELREHCPATKAIILTMSSDEESAITAFRNGASAYVLKQCSVGELIEALVIVSSGGYYLSSRVSEQVLERISRGPAPAEPDDPDKC
jgi:two-component system nitrate/nitrite response regulator NarL